ncbi:putative terminase small subunit [Plesiomonas phage phiP4-7]|nr:putative terminase small subunit [Plesiomonas phage phiP4-7]
MAGENGRPTKYQKAYDEQARKLCLLGYTNEKLADFFNVAVSTIHEWRHEHQSFSDALKAGKEGADAELALTLYERAKGGKRIVKQKVADGAIVDLEEELPPDTTAIIFWLKNRQPKLWRNNPEQEESREQAPIEIKIVDARKPE